MRVECINSVKLSRHNWMKVITAIHFLADAEYTKSLARADYNSLIINIEKQICEGEVTMKYIYELSDFETDKDALYNVSTNDLCALIDGADTWNDPGMDEAMEELCKRCDINLDDYEDRWDKFACMYELAYDDCLEFLHPGINDIIKPDAKE